VVIKKKETKEIDLQDGFQSSLTATTATRDLNSRNSTTLKIPLTIN